MSTVRRLRRVPGLPRHMPRWEHSRHHQLHLPGGLLRRHVHWLHPVPPQHQLYPGIDKCSRMQVLGRVRLHLHQGHPRLALHELQPHPRAHHGRPAPQLGPRGLGRPGSGGPRLQRPDRGYHARAAKQAADGSL